MVYMMVYDGYIFKFSLPWYTIILLGINAYEFGINC